MATTIWVNIASGNGLLSDGTKILADPMFTSDYLGAVAFNWQQFCNESPSYYSTQWVWMVYFKCKCDISQEAFS